MTDTSLDLPQLLAIAAALGFVSGIRLYALLFVVGVAESFGWMHLPDSLQILAHPLVLICLGAMSLIEFLADKFPWVDSAWDAVHTFIRLPAGAALAAAVASGHGEAMQVVLGLIGGTFAATSHFTKAGTRAALNTSPEPFTNIVWSLGEDVFVAAFTWLIVAHPLLAGVLALVCLVLAVWLLRVIWRGVRAVLTRRRNLVSGHPSQ